MSQKYPGGFITKSPVAPTTTAASGIWTLDQQQQAQKAGTWPSPPVFIEDFFSTYLYDGNSSTQTITNGINLSANDGLVWIKSRSGAGPTRNNRLWTTNLGGSGVLQSDSTAALYTYGSPQVTFNSNGFGLSSDAGINATSSNYVSWTFRKQPKFFDIVTWTSTTTTNTNLRVSHNLGSVPGCIIIKATSTTDSWYVYHRELGINQYLRLNATSASVSNTPTWGTSNPTSTDFGFNENLFVASAPTTFVAYLFAHDAGGFPVSGGGSTNGISCGSYTGNGSSTGPIVNLGYEPQFIILKAAAGGTSGSQDWNMIDNMRGWTTSSNQQLNPNLSAAETSQNNIALNATGFQPITAGSDFNGNGNTYIYIAIRRGPMKTPTVGTSVFDVDTRAGSASIAKTNSDILTDLAVIKRYTSASEYWAWTPRLVGNLTLQSNSTDAELSGAMATSTWDTMTGAFCAASNGATNTSTLVDYSFRRAPGFFDEVCYTGDSTARTLTHNLTVVPELMIVKNRTNLNGNQNWQVYSSALGNTSRLQLNTTDSVFTGTFIWNNTSPTASVFSLSTSAAVNGGSDTYVAYLFATCAGVSKVGSYTGTGALLTVNCGFTTGARFVLIKRTDSTGSWYVWDSARGITAGNDPYVVLNTTAAETTGTNYVDTDTTGFQVTAAAPAEINANGGTFIFLAIA